MDSETGGPFPFFAVMQKEIYNILLLKQYFYIFLSKSRIFFSLFIFNVFSTFSNMFADQKINFEMYLLGRKLLSFAVGKNGCETDCSQGCFSSHGKSHRDKSGERKIKNHKKKTIREKNHVKSFVTQGKVWREEN